MQNVEINFWSFYKGGRKLNLFLFILFIHSDHITFFFSAECVSSSLQSKLCRLQSWRKHRSKINCILSHSTFSFFLLFVLIFIYVGSCMQEAYKSKSEARHPNSPDPCDVSGLRRTEDLTECSGATGAARWLRRLLSQLENLFWDMSIFGWIFSKVGQEVMPVTLCVNHLETSVQIFPSLSRCLIFNASRQPVNKSFIKHKWALNPEMHHVKPLCFTRYLERHTYSSWFMKGLIASLQRKLPDLVCKRVGHVFSYFFKGTFCKMCQ